MNRRNIAVVRRNVQAPSGAAPAPPSFSGVVDALIAAGIPPLGAFSTSHRLYSGYTGPLFELENITSGLFANIPYEASTDRTDTAAMIAHNAGANGRSRTLYDQSGNADDLTQGTAAMRPKMFDSVGGPTLRGTLPIAQLVTGAAQGWGRGDAFGLSGNPATAFSFFGTANAGGTRIAIMIAGAAGAGNDDLYAGAGATDRDPILGVDGLARRNFTEVTALTTATGLVYRKANGANISAATCRQDGVDLAQTSVVAGVPTVVNNAFTIGAAVGYGSIQSWDGDFCTALVFGNELAAGAALTAVEAFNAALKVLSV